MKNIKLLLATTAMLSIGLVINTMAGQITADFNVGATLVDHSNGLTKVQDLNFGNIHADSDYGDEQAGRTVILAPDGTVSGTAQQFGGEQVAIVREGNSVSPESDLENLYDISVTGDEKLYDGTGENKKLCGHVSSWTHEKFHYNDNSNDWWSIAYRIGATFALPSADEWYTSAANNAGDGTACSGVATATLIYTGGN